MKISQEHDALAKKKTLCAVPHTVNDLSAGYRFFEAYHEHSE
jgi:hypothetical protein